jgi:hypothetical protein
VDEQDLNVVVTSWLSPAELGDIEVTGNVDFDEFAQFAQGWRQTSDWYRFFAADINNDKKVNFTDFSPLAKDWDQSAAERLYGDLNLDGTVDYLDLGLFVEDWLKRIE